MPQSISLCYACRFEFIYILEFVYSFFMWPGPTITDMPYPQYLSSSSKSMIIGLERTASANVSIQKAVSCGAIYRSHHSSHRRYIITSKIHHGVYKYFRNCLCFLPGAWPQCLAFKDTYVVMLMHFPYYPVP